MAFFSDREIDDLQAAADACRAARTRRAAVHPAPPHGGPTKAGAAGPGTPDGGRRAS